LDLRDDCLADAASAAKAGEQELGSLATPFAPRHNMDPVYTDVKIGIYQILCL